MSSPDVYSWEIYCNNEQKFVTGYSPVPIVVCPNDATHLVNPLSVTQGDKISASQVVVKEDIPATGIFQTTTVPLPIPAAVVVPVVRELNFSFPYDIYMREMSLLSDASNIGDSLTIEIGRDTLIGISAADTLTGTQQIEVHPSVLQYLFKGSEIGIEKADLSAKEYPGIVIDVDEKTNIITVSDPLTQDFLSGSRILFSKKPIKDFYFDSTQRYTIGGKGVDSTYVPAGTTIHTIYTDNTVNVAPTTAYIHIQYYMT